MLKPSKSSPSGFALVLGVVSTVCFFVFSHLSTSVAALPPCDHYESLVSTSALLSALLGEGDRMLLLVFRCVCGLLCLFTTVVLLNDTTNPFTFTYSGSTVSLSGIGRACTFTVQTFLMMTFYFCGVAMLSVNDMLSLLNPSSLQTFSLILNVCFRILYPVSLLITLVVTFVLYPTAVKLQMETQVERFFLWPVVVMHCFNAIMVHFELLLGTPLVDSGHLYAWFTLPVLWGVWYILFSWIFFMRTGVFFYFFLDWRNTIAPLLYVGLILVLLGLNYLEVAMRWAIEGKHVYVCLASIVLVLWICRFRDARKK